MCFFYNIDASSLLKLFLLMHFNSINFSEYFTVDIIRVVLYCLEGAICDLQFINSLSPVSWQ